MFIDLSKKLKSSIKLELVDPLKKVGFGTTLNKNIKKDLVDLLKNMIITFF